MCDMVTLGEKSNILKPRNRISTLISTAFDLKTSKSSVRLSPMGSLYV
jgi:hypothetical protein